MTEDADVQIEGIRGYLTDEEIRSLIGGIIHVPVGGEIPPGGISWIELFRFARVMSVTPRSRWLFRRCRRCGTRPSRFKFAVEWEAGYQSPEGDVLCEHCIDGVVIKGHEHIAFGGTEPLSTDITITANYNLTKKQDGYFPEA
ncbi:hypothetical protein ACFLQ0_04700 [Nitrospinota bacterium]